MNKRCGGIMVKKVSFRLTLASAGALLMVVSVMVFLNYTKFQSIFTSFYTSRIDYTIRDMKDTIEFSLRLGLPISDLKNTQDLVDAAQKGDEEILSAQIFSPGGTVIFSTQKDLQTRNAAAEWQKKAAASDDIWFLYEQEAMVVGIPLLNAIDQVAGTLVLNYSRLRYDGILKSMLWDMMKIGTAIFILGTLVTMILSMMMFNRTMKGFIRVSRLLEQIESGHRITPGQIEPLAPLEQRFVNICLPIHAALDRINQVMESISPSPKKSQEQALASPEEDRT